MIVKSNIIIAEFMGGSYLRRKDPFDKKLIEEIEYEIGKHPFISNADYINTENVVHLRYHCDWSWLMPVLDKICRIKIGDGIKYVEFAYPRTFGTLNEETGQMMVRLNGFQLFQSDTLIEATYLAIIDFIEWYNKT